MAVQSIRCPNCNGEVKMDENLEKGFCMYCGSAIQVKDEIAKIKIEHSGKVEIDESKKLTNAISLADRAFATENYQECYRYCCVALECDANNAHAAFRKGLCAAYISISRMNELEQGLSMALAVTRKAAKNEAKEIYQIASELLAFTKAKYKANVNQAKDFVYPNLSAVNNTFSILATLTRLCAMCEDLITNEMMAVDAAFENQKRCALLLGMELCEQGLGQLKYFKGYQQINKGTYYIQQATYESVRSPFRQLQNDYYAKFKADFNNLPSTRRAMEKYDGQITGLKTEIDAFDQRLKAYFDANPAVAAAYNKSAWIFTIPALVLFILIGVVGVLLTAGGVSDNVCSTILGVLSVAFVVCVILAVEKAVEKSRKRKEILNQLPPELAEMKAVYDQNQSKLRSIKNERAAFERTNIRR